jgi:hypothetical protein
MRGPKSPIGSTASRCRSGGPRDQDVDVIRRSAAEEASKLLVDAHGWRPGLIALGDDRHMEDVLSPGLLDKGDGLNPTRALILQAYYALRRTRLPVHIGTRDISVWIKAREPEESLPSDSLIRLTVMSARLAHRAPGRPRHDGPARVTAPPFLPALRRRRPDPVRR